MRQIPSLAIALSLLVSSALPWSMTYAQQDTQDTQTALRVYTIEQRSAADMLNAIRPFLSEHDTVNLDGPRIILRSNTAQLDAIGELITQLDQASHQWRIQLQQLPADAHPPNSERNIKRSATRSSSPDFQSLRISEGAPAMIEIGQLSPVASQKTNSQGHSQTRIEQQKTSNGFRVIAHAAGANKVRLRIQPYSVNPSAAGGGIVNLQHSETVITINTNTWQLISRNSNHDDANSKNKIHRTGERDVRLTQLWVYVAEE